LVRLTVASAFLAVCFAADSAAAQSLTNLGTLAGASNSFAIGISRDGSKVAGHSGLDSFIGRMGVGMRVLWNQHLR
jgi:uncharacterized membrane protein